MQEKKHLFTIIKNAFFYSTGIFFTQLINFFLIPVYSRLLSVTEYGMWGILQVTQSLAVAILSLGLTNALSRIYYDNQDIQDKLKYTASIFWFLIYVSIGFILFSTLLSKNINLILFNGGQPQVLIYLLIFSISSFLILNTSFSFLNIKIRPKIYSIAYVINTFLYHPMAIYLLRVGFGIKGILAAGIFSYTISIFFIFFYIKEDVSPSKYDFNLIKVLIKNGIPLMILAVISWVIDLSDRYFLKYYIGTVEVGLYSLSNQIVYVIAFINTVFIQAVPIYLFKVREENRQLGEYLQTEFFRYYMVVVLFITLLLSLFSKEIVLILSPSSYVKAYKFISLLAFSQVFLGGFFILHVGIANAKKFNYLLICFIVSGLFNILLNILLIPKYAGLGAALATTISYFMLMVLGNFYSQKLYYMKWDYQTTILLFGIAILFTIAGNIRLIAVPLPMIFYKVVIVVTYGLITWKIGFRDNERNYMRQILKFPIKIRYIGR